MIDIRPEHIGYFEGDYGNRTEMYNPCEKYPCLICGEPYVEETVRTISTWEEGSTKSLFYFVHRKCHDRLTIEEENMLRLTILGVGYDW